MKTKRIQNNKIMSKGEKEAYIKIIRNMPWLYSPIIQEIRGCKGKNLLDVACGDGYLLEQIEAKYPHLRLNGIDIDPFFKDKSRYDIEIKDAFDLDKKYDIIICNLALHHFDYPSKLIKLLYSNSKILIISDQLRPENEKELKSRLELRNQFIKSIDEDYYKENEKDSILEAYSKKEVVDIFKKTRLPSKMRFLDNDYYERFISII